MTGSCAQNVPETYVYTCTVFHIRTYVHVRTYNPPHRRLHHEKGLQVGHHDLHLGVDEDAGRRDVEESDTLNGHRSMGQYREEIGT